MTKKDFELIAKTINGMPVPFFTIHAVAYAFAVALGKANPLFDRARFIEACEADL